MNQEQQMVHQFHERFGLVTNARPSVPGGNVHRLRTLLIEEELLLVAADAGADDVEQDGSTFQVKDGGACFFRVQFSVKTKTFHSLQVNGNA